MAEQQFVVGTKVQIRTHPDPRMVMRCGWVHALAEDTMAVVRMDAALPEEYQTQVLGDPVHDILLRPEHCVHSRAARTG